MIDISQYSKETALQLLKEESSMSAFEKNVAFIYYFPEPIMHMELPGILMEKRGSHPEGYMRENEFEILTLLRAYRGKQYHNFILHLLHSFIQDPSKVYVIEDGEEQECAICKKLLYSYRPWDERCKKNPAFGEQFRREHLQFGSEESSLTMCIDCLIQLQGLHNLLMELEGPRYLYEFQTQKNTLEKHAKPKL